MRTLVLLVLLYNFTGTALGIYWYDKLKPAQKVLTFVFLVTFLNECFIRVADNLDQIQYNYHAYWIYSIVYFPLQMLAITLNLKGQLRRRIGFASAGIVFVVNLVQFMMLASVGFPTPTIMLAVPVLIFLIVLLFYEMLEDDDEVPLHLNPRFILGITFMVFWTFNFTYFAFRMMAPNIAAFHSVDGINDALSHAFYLGQLYVLFIDWRSSRKS